MIRKTILRLLPLIDGVHTNNINFLLACYTLLGETRALEPLQRAMTCVLALQGGKPQAGWAMQHKLDLNYSPGHARDFERQVMRLQLLPRCVAT